MGFQDKLQYSACSEDSDSEISALAIEEGDRVVAVAGGGGRALSLLNKPLANLDAIDFNQNQIAITALKRAAIVALNFHEFELFLGINGEQAERAHLIERVLVELSEKDRKHWKKRSRMLLKGVIYQGELEKRFKFGAAVLKFILGSAYLHLIESENLNQQKNALEKLLESWRFKFLVRLGTNPLLFRLLHDNWGFYKGTDPGLNISKHMSGLLVDSLRNRLIGESALFQLIFKGEYSPKGLKPGYLREDEYDRIKSNINRVQIKQIDIVSYFEQIETSQKLKISLSNVPTFLSASERQNLWRLLSAKLQTGSIVCIRQFLSDHRPPENISKNFERMVKTEERLNINDRSVFYRFQVLRKI